MNEPRSAPLLDRALLDETAAQAMAGRVVDLAAVTVLAERNRARARRRAVRLAVGTSAVAGLAAAAVLALAVFVPGFRLAAPAPAVVPEGPGAIPSRVGIAPPWTPVASDRPIGRVALVLSGSQRGVATGSEEENQAAMERVPATPVLVGADPAGGGDQYRLLPDGGSFADQVAVSPDGAWVAWEREPDGTPDLPHVGVLHARTGSVYDVELPGSWNRGVSLGRLAFTEDGGQLRLRGGDRMEYHGIGPDRVWAVDVRDGAVGPVHACDCRPDDVPWPLYDGEDAPPLARTQTPRELEIVAVASQIVASGGIGPEAVPGRWGRDADWYPWVAGRGVDVLTGHPRTVAFALFLLVVGLRFRRARRFAVSGEPGQASDAEPGAEPHAGFAAGGGGAGFVAAKATTRWVSRGVLGVIALGVLTGLVLGTVSGLGLGLPEPVPHAGGGYVVPSVISAPPSKLEPAFEKEGEPRTTRVSLVTRLLDGPMVGLDAATGAWVSLSSLPGLPDPLSYDSHYNPLVVSPSGRYVLRAGFLDGSDPTLLIDLQQARVRRIELPFGTDPGNDETASQDTAAVLDDGTVAIVRGNLGALWLVRPDGTKQEITAVGDVRSVSAQPGQWLLVSRPRTFQDESEKPRVDLLDVRTGRVSVASTDIGDPTVLATVSVATVLAWQDDQTGRRLVGLPGANGKTVIDGTWSAGNGGVEALWPSEQGMLIGLGWSKGASNTLLRADSGVDGSTSLRPFAAFADLGRIPLPALSVAGSVVAQAELVDPPSQPWWGRLAWRVIDRF